MKKLFIKGIKVMVAAVSLTFAVAIVTSTSINAEIISKYNTSGKNASADFFSKSNGKYVNGHLMVSDMMFKDGPGAPERPGPMGTIMLDVFDPRSGQSLWGFGEIRMEEFDISNSLRDAHVVGTAVVELQRNWYYGYYTPYSPYGPIPPIPPVDPDDLDDLDDPNRIEPEDPNIPYPPFPPYPPYPPYPPFPPPPIIEKIAIDVTWTSTGDFMTGHFSSKSSYGDIRIFSRSFGRFCDAETSGTIIGTTFKIDLDESPYYPYDPYGPYYAPYPMPYPMPYPTASIGKFKDGVMVISKP